MLERRLGSVRPDISATINGVPVAIEVQIVRCRSKGSWSARSNIIAKESTFYGFCNGLPNWTKNAMLRRLGKNGFTACYFGRVYYWLRGVEVLEYRFEPTFRVLPRTMWIDNKGKPRRAGGYVRRAVRFRTPNRGKTFNIVVDFEPRNRFWWEGGGIMVPDAKLFIAESERWNHKQDRRLG